MAQLHSFRKGWQSEHLAKYILSKFSFVAEPSTISDDVGLDFFCTLFNIEGGRLFPRNSFAIQIKSKGEVTKNKNKIAIPKPGYLNILEIPFLVGIVDRDNLKMEIFSGEAIDHIFTQYGDPTNGGNTKVFIELLDKRIDEKLYETKGNRCFMKFPKVVEIDAHFDYEKSTGYLDELFKICSLIQENISSKRSQEYIYKLYGSNRLQIYAGSGSVRVFKENFFKRLAEVFFNLEWIARNSSMALDLNEFNLYKGIYLELKKRYGELPEYLTLVFSRLNALIEEKHHVGTNHKEIRSE